MTDTHRAEGGELRQIIERIERLNAEKQEAADAYSVPCSVKMLGRIIRYEPETGLLFWKERPQVLFKHSGRGGQQGAAARWNAKHAGKPALNASANGYRCGHVLGVGMRAHRVAWALSFGDWPSRQIDHINGDRADNRLANLRIATPEQNARNAKLRKDNQSGVSGVYRNETSWVVQIGSGTSRKYIGSFETIEAAVSARRSAEKQFGYHKNHGRA